MLSTFLSQIQSYFSKQFFVASFFPLLGFAFANGAVAYFLFSPWQAWADKNLLQAGEGAFYVSTAAVGVAFGAIVLSSLSTFLRQRLEGKWGPVARFFTAAEDRRRQRLILAKNQAEAELPHLEKAPEWVQTVLQAQERGRQNHPNGAEDPAAVAALRLKIAVLEDKKTQLRSISTAEIEPVITQLITLFEGSNPDRSPGLIDLWQQTGYLIDYTTDGSDLDPLSARARYARLQNEFNSNFGTRELAPTKMGNIGNTIQGYALRRYNCNMESLWSNLQHVVRQDEKAQAALMEAKTQLDFLIACCWLTLFSALVWAVVFFEFVPSRKGFLGAAIAGPLIAYLWYRAAVEQYRSFADVAMTTFDMFRFSLLDGMRLLPPKDVMHERVIWEELDKLTKFGEEQNFFYGDGKK